MAQLSAMAGTITPARAASISSSRTMPAVAVAARARSSSRRVSCHCRSTSAQVPIHLTTVSPSRTGAASTAKCRSPRGQPQPVGVGPAGHLFVQGPLPRLDGGGAVVGVEGVGPSVAAELLPALPGHPLPAGARLGHAALGAGHPHHLGSGVDQTAVALQRAAAFLGQDADALRGGHLFGDLDDDTEHAVPAVARRGVGHAEGEVPRHLVRRAGTDQVDRHTGEHFGRARGEDPVVDAEVAGLREAGKGLADRPAQRTVTEVLRQTTFMYVSRCSGP